MKALRTLRTAKSVVDATGWGVGLVPKTAFPLSHAGPQRLGKGWHWCVYNLQDDHRGFRLLVAFEPGKLQYKAWLGVSFGSDQAVVARVEFHASHDAWHCHWKTGELDDVSRGVVTTHSGKERRHKCGGVGLTLNKDQATAVAFDLFNVGSWADLQASPEGQGSLL